jgi:hypothetical protein
MATELAAWTIADDPDNGKAVCWALPLDRGHGGQVAILSNDIRVIQEVRAISGTLIVAIIALVISVSSLTWQVVLYLLGGARVRTELRIGALGVGAAVHAPVSEHVAFAHLAQQGFDEPVFVVRARNAGRLAASITKWEIAFDNGGAMSLPQWDANKDHPLPYRLEPGGEAVWFCPTAPIRKAIDAYAAVGMPVRLLRAQVGLGGTGKSVTSKNAMWV